jgi:hypothetical protein
LNRTPHWSPPDFDPTRPTNSVESTAAFVGVSRGLAYTMARSGAWPSIRVGRRLLIVTSKLLAQLGLE